MSELCCSRAEDRERIKQWLKGKRVVLFWCEVCRKLNDVGKWLRKEGKE